MLNNDTQLAQKAKVEPEQEVKEDATFTEFTLTM
jgi:hypothetical protein